MHALSVSPKNGRWSVCMNRKKFWTLKRDKKTRVRECKCTLDFPRFVLVVGTYLWARSPPFCVLFLLLLLWLRPTNAAALIQTWNLSLCPSSKAFSLSMFNKALLGDFCLLSPCSWKIPPALNISTFFPVRPGFLPVLSYFFKLGFSRRSSSCYSDSAREQADRTMFCLMRSRWYSQSFSPYFAMEESFSCFVFLPSI